MPMEKEKTYTYKYKETIHNYLPLFISGMLVRYVTTSQRLFVQLIVLIKEYIKVESWREMHMLFVCGFGSWPEK